ncbi:MAG TPA: YicC/YloC family endoribonuclease [Limnochordia bacterium]
MIMSMTGFGRGQAQADGIAAVVEARSVNHRFLDVVVRMPRGYVPLEARVRKVAARIGRGRLELNVRVDDPHQEARTVRLDRGLLGGYADAIAQARAALGLSGELQVRELLLLPELFVIEDAEGDLERAWRAIEPALERALAALTAVRRQEGERIGQEIAAGLERLASLVTEIGARSTDLIAAYRERLAQRARELCGDKVSPDRLAAEVVLFAERSAIDEEIARLKSHLAGIEEALQATEPIGRKLDFYLQEMGRELNTIAAKAPGGGIGSLIVEAKAELERIREQVQNVA